MTNVLFLCNSNRGKSQMAAGLAKMHAPDWNVNSAGMKVEKVGEPGDVNAESVFSLQYVGADMSQGVPQPFTSQLAAAADKIIVVGGAELDETMPEVAGKVERWIIEDPSLRGIEGTERMEALRDDINVRVKDLVKRLGS